MASHVPCQPKGKPAKGDETKPRADSCLHDRGGLRDQPMDPLGHVLGAQAVRTAERQRV